MVRRVRPPGGTTTREIQCCIGDLDRLSVAYVQPTRLGIHRPVRHLLGTRLRRTTVAVGLREWLPHDGSVESHPAEPLLGASPLVGGSVDGRPTDRRPEARI